MLEAALIPPVMGNLLIVSIFSRTPVDRSMIGFAVFGLLIFYFSLYHRPLRFLDRMLSDIASELSDAFSIFDPNGKCVWANERGRTLAGIKDERYDKAAVVLTELFGDLSVRSKDVRENSVRPVVGTDGEIRYYTLEENQVTDSKKMLTGSYLLYFGQYFPEGLLFHRYRFGNRANGTVLRHQSVQPVH